MWVLLLLTLIGFFLPLYIELFFLVHSINYTNLALEQCYDPKYRLALDILLVTMLSDFTPHTSLWGEPSRMSEKMKNPAALTK